MNGKTPGIKGTALFIFRTQSYFFLLSSYNSFPHKQLQKSSDFWGSRGGSQLNLLDYLNSHNGQPAESLRSFYNLGATLYPEYYKEYSFEQWLGFLKDQLLIREDGGLISITIRGREFLMHLARAGLSRNKAG